jgi:hypothetical protein
MSGPKREKFSIKVNSETLSAIRALAKREGRQLCCLIKFQKSQEQYDK